MSITTRVQRLVKASIHEGLERMEDPLALVKQDIRDTKESIKKKKADISKQENMNHVFERSIEMAGKLAQKRQDQATVAIEKEEEDFARRALLEKKQALKEQDRYRELIEQNKDLILQLKEEAQELEQSLVYKAEQQQELEYQKEAARAGAELEKMYTRTNRISKQSFEETEVFDKWKQAAVEIENEDLKAEIEEELAQLKASRKSE
ncbi:PspA/IM30 family protein [Alkalicoccobacillus murimartini]|uniref:Phage shock protein A/lia operon protein LiaH n=1 Tax=Alkalicoccobacillus murimartini TaxID=171685 RepID=A0ABT9YBV2_9BACI|nr:PspA/IM30 family protein [Alkalicoccobacillus murimartini]MDQ0205324.1 phage shock protein A/lia operon protein LiaH [Alkalicoccobacillus murimartini]